MLFNKPAVPDWPLDGDPFFVGHNFKKCMNVRVKRLNVRVPYAHFISLPVLKMTFSYFQKTAALSTLNYLPLI